MLDFSRCRLEPFQHQREDTEWLMTRPFAFIASEMRTGKTKIVIDTAHFLFESGQLDKVIIIAPAPVRDGVWYEPNFGEIAKHAWDGVSNQVIEFHEKLRMWDRGMGDKPLWWILTNYEFIRSKNRLKQLLKYCGTRTLLVLDESSFVKNATSQQSKACLQLRRACGRVFLINGTPIFYSPMDLYSQGNILHPKILECPHASQFKARYAIQKPVLTHGGKPLDNGYGKPVMQIKDWTNLDDLQRRFAPYTIRRLQKDCLDLPPKLDPVTLTAALTPEAWQCYKRMRDELMVWLSHNKVVTAATAGVKTLRLSQITNGFLTGVEDAVPGQPHDDELIDTYFYDLPLIERPAPVVLTNALQEIGREKIDVLLWFIGAHLPQDPNLHLVVWCRFRHELARIYKEVTERFPQFEAGMIWGTQKQADRTRALSLLHPDTSPKGPTFVAGIEGTGSLGLNMCAAHTCVSMSSGYSPGRVAQTLDRVYGPGQTLPIAYYDVIATGPRGQKTIDHTILTARRAGENIATWTAAAWIRALRKE